jgi:uncharacterized protein
MIRAVLDANVLISAVLSAKGSPAAILAYWQKGGLEVVVSEAILREVERVIHYPRIQGRYPLSEEKIERFLGLLRRYAILVKPREQIDAIEDDPSDNRYLEAALAGEASYIVSGDHHLLDLKRYRDIQILAPNEFMTFLKLERKD